MDSISKWDKEATDRWIRENPVEVYAALNWLRSNPFEFTTIATLGRMKVQKRRVTFEGTEGERQRVREFLDNSLFNPCWACLRPVIEFPNGSALNWPDFDRHECEVNLPAKKPAPRRQSTRVAPL